MLRHVARVYDAKLVLRINEIYHDLEGAAYARRHPEIFGDEVERWQRMGERLLPADRPPAAVLDVGSGTGFVPIQLLPCLREGDSLTCADISETMLEVCRCNVQSLRPTCRCDYIKLDGSAIPLADASCCLITLNSVVHHVPELPPFFADLNRLLAPGGRLVIAHEPNRRFYQHPLLWWNHRLMSLALAPRQAAGALLRRLGLIDAARSVLRRAGSSRGELWAAAEAVNRILLAEKLVQEPLSVDEITEMVDFHSPTAGGIHRDRGIDMGRILEWLPGFEMEELETYNHLGDAVTPGRLTRRYEAALKRRFPECGATLLAVLHKRA